MGAIRLQFCWLLFTTPPQHLAHSSPNCSTQMALSTEISPELQSEIYGALKSNSKNFSIIIFTDTDANEDGEKKARVDLTADNTDYKADFNKVVEILNNGVERSWFATFNFGEMYDMLNKQFKNKSELKKTISADDFLTKLHELVEKNVRRIIISYSGIDMKSKFSHAMMNNSLKSTIGSNDGHFEIDSYQMIPASTGEKIDCDGLIDYIIDNSKGILYHLTSK